MRIKDEKLSLDLFISAIVTDVSMLTRSTKYNAVRKRHDARIPIREVSVDPGEKHIGANGSLSMARYPIFARKNLAATLEAEIFAHVTREEFLLTEAKWSAFKELHCPDTQYLPSNHHWNWNNKSSTPTFAACKFLALKYAGEIEGLAQLSLSPIPSRNPKTKGWPVLYVEYLETAPWNQKAYAGTNRRFFGVGTCLITLATEESYRCGCEGRLALHSLDDAKSFYIDQGFINLGLDPAEMLDYFELHDIVLEK